MVCVYNMEGVWYIRADTTCCRPRHRGHARLCHRLAAFEYVHLRQSMLGASVVREGSRARERRPAAPCTAGLAKPLARVATPGHKDSPVLGPTRRAVCHPRQYISAIAVVLLRFPIEP